MEAYRRGRDIVQEQDDLHRLLDIVENDIKDGEAYQFTQQVLFARIEKFVGQKPASIKEARQLIDKML
jgi:hypothetical protein